MGHLEFRFFLRVGEHIPDPPSPTRSKTTTIYKFSRNSPNSPKFLTTASQRRRRTQFCKCRRETKRGRLIPAELSSSGVSTPPANRAVSPRISPGLLPRGGRRSFTRTTTSPFGRLDRSRYWDSGS